MRKGLLKICDLWCFVRVQVPALYFAGNLLSCGTFFVSERDPTYHLYEKKKLVIRGRQMPLMPSAEHIYELSEVFMRMLLFLFYFILFSYFSSNHGVSMEFMAGNHH
jgi:hypothetical protein